MSGQRTDGPLGGHFLRAATPADVPALAAIDQSAFAASERWNQRLWSGELEADNRFVEVAVDGHDRVVGVISVQIVGPTAELIRIAVDSGRLRQGLGGMLIGAGLHTAVRAEAEEMLLEVRHDNTAATGLYRRWGFTEIARRERYYGPDADAVIMQRELEDPEDD